MSAKKPVEFMRPPRRLGGNGISVSVKFHYPDGKTWRGGLTIHAESKQELKERLKEAYYDKRPNSGTNALVDSLQDETELDFEDEP